jgi:leucyl-tRNA synthetase
MDTFVDSSWYFLRYFDSRNTSQLSEPSKSQYWMPIDVYIGGMEHAILHLLYARFVHKFLLKEKAISAPDEPFR